jgi:hypothetical protein
MPQLHVIDVARLCHEVNRAYCRAIGDFSQVPWGQAEEWQRQSAIAGAQKAVDDPDATPEQMHESWMAQKIADGWKYGDEKDPEAKTHPCLIPYHDLPLQQRTKDHLFLGVVNACRPFLED